MHVFLPLLALKIRGPVHIARTKSVTGRRYEKQEHLVIHDKRPINDLLERDPGVDKRLLQFLDSDRRTSTGTSRVRVTSSVASIARSVPSQRTVAVGDASSRNGSRLRSAR